MSIYNPHQASEDHQRLLAAIDDPPEIDLSDEEVRSLMYCLATTHFPNLRAAHAGLREQVAAHLLTHVGGDETDQWQAGHNYAMREAARLIRESWDQLALGDGE